MKIVYLTIYPPRGAKHHKAGGVASYTKNLVTNFPKSKGDELYVLCNKINDKFKSYTEEGVRVTRCFNRSPRFIYQSLRQIKKIRPDIVHVQQELAVFGNVITAYLLQLLLHILRKQKVATCVTLHGVVSLKEINQDFIQRNRSHLPVWFVKLNFYLIYRPIVNRSTSVIVHEEYFKSILVKEYKADSAKIHVINHGVESIRPLSKERACIALGIDAERDIVLFNGYLTGYKGVDLLLKGFSDYSKINPNAFLIIAAGEHPRFRSDPSYIKDYKGYQKSARKLIPRKQYEWVGYIEEKDIPKYFSASDVSIYPYTISMSSSGPMSMAMGIEKPFLVSTAFQGIFSDQRILFEKSHDKLCEKLEYFFKTQKTYKDIARNLKRNRLWPVIAKQTLQVYRATIK